MLLRTSPPRSSAGDWSLPPEVPRRAWSALGRSTDRYLVFDDALTEDRPEPVRRWLRHSIAPGTSLLTGAELDTVGQIRIGHGWSSYRARQRMSLRGGFVWSARTRLFGLPVRGFDRFTDGTAQMEWRAAGGLTLMSATGTEVSLSAAGRHAAEVLSALPAVALDRQVTWDEVDGNRVTAEVPVGDHGARITLTIGARGELRQLQLLRWGKPVDEAYGLHRFGAMFDGEAWFGGYRLPTMVTAGWHFGTPRWTGGRFLTYRVCEARFH